jgi:hypothetical protein
VGALHHVVEQLSEPRVSAGLALERRSPPNLPAHGAQLAGELGEQASLTDPWLSGDQQDVTCTCRAPAQGVGERVELPVTTDARFNDKYIGVTEKNLERVLAKAEGVLRNHCGCADSNRSRLRRQLGWIVSSRTVPSGAM